MIKLTLESLYLPYAVLELPNPQFDDAVALDNSVDIKYSMAGGFYSYVKSSIRFLLTMQFERIGYGRTRSVADFFRAFAGLEFILEDHNDQVWTVRFDQEEFEFTNDGRMGPDGNVRREYCSFELKFVGTKNA